MAYNSTMVCQRHNFLHSDDETCARCDAEFGPRANRSGAKVAAYFSSLNLAWCMLALVVVTALLRRFVW